jgi:peptide chain release factor 1
MLINYPKYDIISKVLKKKREISKMFQKLEDVEKKYDELTVKISDPEIISQQNEWKTYMKEHAELEPIVLKYREYKKTAKELEEAKEMMEDPEMKELAEMEMLEKKELLPKLEEELKILLIPKDPDDDKNVICEIRAGTGGDEAALFAGTLFRMYNMYAERKHWKLEVLNENETGLGGYKEISFMITGKGAYSRMKFESGTHRVQRVPDTESSGRIHTSAATVAVLPVVEDVEIEINPADIKMDVFRASGAGGQHVNKTSSAVRLTHIPTGIVAECQTERSQVQNREYAMRLLRSRLYEIEKEKQDSELANARKTQVGSGDRSEKIRTYNYPQGRITDHRIGMSIYQMEDFLNGNLDEMINNLIAADRAERLRNE